MTTFKQFKDNPQDVLAELPQVVYVKKNYIVVNNEGAICLSGTAKEILNQAEMYGSYYDNCEFMTREHDLHMNDNTRIDYAI